MQARDIILSEYAGAVEAFNAFNHDGNNWLSRAEFNQGMIATGSTFTRKQRRNLWKRLKPLNLSKLKKLMREEWETLAPSPTMPPTTLSTRPPREPTTNPTPRPPREPDEVKVPTTNPTPRAPREPDEVRVPATNPTRAERGDS
jgi:hypothetical protein